MTSAKEELLTIAEQYRQKGMNWEADFWANEAETYREYP